MRWKREIYAATGLLGVIAAVLFFLPADDLNAAVLAEARAIPDGGGYCALNDTGVGREIIHDGVQILRRSKEGKRYCSGFTFEVAMQVLSKSQRLRELEPYQISEMQRTWYGVTQGSAAKQAVQAITTFRLGREVRFQEAKAGDFIVFSRVRSGHSAVFLGWILRQNEVIGFKYRSSQQTSGGVGDAVEYFIDSGREGAGVRRDLTFLARLTR